MPSHAPPHAVPSVVHGGRPPIGAPVAAEHVPTLPETLHAAHWPLHAASQQTPSTQNPDVHWFVAPHVLPFGSFDLHTPAEQNAPDAQSESMLHPPAHLVPVLSHANGVQSCVMTVGQLPDPEHVAESVAIPEAHVAARQLVDAVG